jgi:hypothetical protein
MRQTDFPCPEFSARGTAFSVQRKIFPIRGKAVERRIQDSGFRFQVSGFYDDTKLNNQ